MNVHISNTQSKLRTRAFIATIAIIVAPLQTMHAQNAPITVYFEGTSQYILPDGRTVPGGGMLTSRTYNPAAGTITEQLVTGATRTRPATEMIVNVSVTEGKFTMSEASGALKGEGALQGPAWHWTSWNSTASMRDGSHVEAVDSVSATTLIVHRRVRAADGSDQVRVDESYRTIDEARFNARRKELLQP